MTFWKDHWRKLGFEYHEQVMDHGAMVVCAIYKNGEFVRSQGLTITDKIDQANKSIKQWLADTKAD